MIVNLPSLKTTLQGNVCEILFVKRRPKPGDSSQRRMLCTLDESLLNSVNGRTTLNYKPPSGPPKYNPASKNLLPVWDIMMQGWRMVSMDNCAFQRMNFLIILMKIYIQCLQMKKEGIWVHEI